MRPEGQAEKTERPATARVFFGLWPSPELAGQLAAIAEAAAGQFGGRPTRLDTIHLTLAFLGDIPEAQLPTLCDVARRVAFRPFELTLDQVGFWPRPRLLWAGCRASVPALGGLVAELREGIVEAGFSAHDHERTFIPHVTLVRRIPASPAGDIAHRLPPIAPLRWPCQDFVLVRSQLAVTGSRYQTIARFSAPPLGA
ncbi:RNA 2',3'-cyclic phosphodiesterase [Dechloromonas sp. A34]|uniref:RNA 2',3'-cyclic phosphodiesterase n=1 Tax=Dechloromonas sp. A34 TaxID=447588 RepID=UPI002248F737|nr:RNA 2',3'-cyclic phosphodiesterase [Dechloromonas sp. A34]